ncbi:hypothetical protein AN958_08496 [Leucoagaricus sp. SymC.cos]|nr:hypothetical protein AN958_08496 [Leucoagaricus sp. SymC.cos]
MAPSASNSLKDVATSPDRPWGLHWRTSYWFTTYVIGLGVAVDIVVYSIIVPVVPFQLEHLGYTGISALSGWLLFAYSGGLLVATIPVAVLSERYNSRKHPMLAGLIALITSQILFMEAPSFAVMCLARIFQGISSAVVWVVGLAFLCDATPKEIIGRQIGFAMSGQSIGLILGSPIGGTLYSRFGFRGPFVFTIICASIDLLSRLAIIEPNESRKWGVDPTIYPRSTSGSSKETAQLVTEGILPREASSEPQSGIESVDCPLSLVQVMLKLFKSSRALVALVMAFVYGFVYSSQEPILPLHLQSIWGLTSKKVGVFLLALSVPMLFKFKASSITGWLTDKFGAEWVAPASMMLAVPWFGILTIESSLPLFGVAFVLESFFTSGAISPLTAELAAVSRNIQGVGYAHMYAAFNVAFGIGTTIGPIVSGQMYDHIQKGWLATCILGAALLFVAVLLTIPYTGDKPLLTRLRNALMV